MDTAGAESVESPAGPAVPGSAPLVGPSIGVPSIPPVGGRSLVPSPVPSVATVVPLATGGPVRTRPDGFPAGVADQLRAYVYLLVDPRTGRPFFVGRGRGDRCFQHLAEARATDPGVDAAPEDPVLDRIRQAESTGREVRVDILSYGLKGAEADRVARAARDVLGLATGPGDGGGRTAAAELGARLAKRAKFKHAHPVVLLRVGPGSDHAYEAVRHHWRVGRRWVDLDSPRSPRWAVVVVGDLVANVYRLESWEPTRGGTGPAGAGGRYSFVGTVDVELERRYRDRSVAPYFGDGAPAPVTYVWCGPHWVNTAR